MTRKSKIGLNQRGKGVLGFMLFVSLVGVLFFGFLDFAGAYVFDAEMQNTQEVQVEDQIRIEFTQPILSFGLDNIEISPFIGFSYSLSDNRKSLSIIPNQTFDFEKKYKITLSDIRGLGGLVLYNKEFVFFTPRKEEGIALSDNIYVDDVLSDFSILSLSSDRYVPPESSRVKKETGITTHISEGKYIDVSLSQQVMTLFENGVKVNEFLISSGKYGMPTPLGEFKVQRKETNHWSYQYKLWMSYSMNFSGPYYIHELPYWPNGYREGESHLGIRVSHGCIRLGIGPAKYVFDWAEIGTSIYVHR
ncbi:MAG: L,D-transpeptidase [Candidatus Paceibacterota bacterium]